MLNRRQLLQTLISATVASALPASALISSSARAASTLPWKNWSGNQQCVPANRVSPSTLAGLQDVMRTSKGTIRCVGAGHSFSSLVPTDDTLLSIRRMSGIDSVDEQRQQATIWGGSILSEIGPALAEQNQALVNMPDIDQQTLAGAIATSTHGTGQGLGSLSSYVVGLELVTANGDLIQCSEEDNTDVFRAAQNSLGALGVITRIRMQNRSPFKLKREARWMPFDEAIEAAPKIAASNRNFEFYYFPFTGMTLGDYLNETSEPVSRAEEIDGNSGVMDLKAARDYLSWSSKLRELILGAYMKTIDPEVNVDHSYAIYATERNVRFNEMEYHMPADKGLAALKEIRRVVERDFPEVFFPIECRFVKADDIWLSPFYQRDTVSVAVHRYFEEDYQPLFKAIEPILKAHEGRPHWGKLNTLGHDDFKARYPRWEDFKRIRKELDPEGRFLNPYLRRVFEA